jgi:hypothetical protein
MSDEPLNPFTQQQIRKLAEEVLRRAEVIDVLPTPMDAVREAAGVREMVDMSDLPDDLEAKKPPRWKRILGALWFRERVVFLDRDEPRARQRFTDGHEATHSMCPWHETTIRFDNEQTLYGQLIEQIDNEANYGAARLIFQGPRFHGRALKEQVSIRTPLEMVSEYDASRHATLHYYVQEHPDAVALLIAGRFPYADGTVPVWRTVESPAFLRRFGRLRKHLPNGQLRVIEGELAPLADIWQASKLTLDPPSKKIGLHDGDGSRHTFLAEAFFNQRCHFVLFVERKARLLGKRARLVEREAALQTR